MLVRELMQFLQGRPQDARVVVEYDGKLTDCFICTGLLRDTDNDETPYIVAILSIKNSDG